jgi:7 transmembrane receptor (rhodopsin family)
LYEQYNVLILIPDPNNKTVPIDYSIGQVCATNKKESLQYFVFIFVFIFIPLLIAFLWLNIVIAKEIWDRRHPIECTASQSVSSRPITGDRRSAETNTKNVSTVSGVVPSEKPQKSFGSNSRAQYSTTPATVKHANKDMSHNPRKQRQLRMVKVIVVIMTIFFICRLPNWAFLLVKLKVRLVGTIYWVIHYLLGILSMASCLLNPFVYTFLSETIQFTSLMANVCRKLCFWKCKSKRTDGDVKVPDSFKNLGEHGGVYLGDNK